jgi:hypothetical protein
VNWAWAGGLSPGPASPAGPAFRRRREAGRPPGPRREASAGGARPYNKYLGWELRQHPLADPVWDAERLLPRLRSVLADGDAGTQRDLFGDLATTARSAGLGHVINA